jgi:L-fuconolactonase
MRIDAHQHFWIYQPEEYEWIEESLAMLRRDFLPEQPESELRKSGFQRSVAVQARQSLEETRWLLELANRSSSIRGVVGWVDLRSAELRAQLAEFAGNPKFVGVRHIVQSEPDHRFLLQPELLRGISVLEEFDLAYDILIYERHLAVAADFVERFPRQRFVLDHLAKPPIKSGEMDSWSRGIRRLGEFPNVFCKLSGLVTEADWQRWTPEQITPYLDIAMDAFGQDQLMIGSDWPVCLVAALYQPVMDLVRDYVTRKNPEWRAGLLGGNAARFCRLIRN